MTARLRVHPKAPVKQEKFDILLCAVGFEARASFVAKTRQGTYKKGIAFAFTERRVLNFKDNYAWFEQNGFTIVDFEATFDGLKVLGPAIEAAQSRPPGITLSILVDISSMSRPLIASVISWLSFYAEDQPIFVNFAYCPSAYVELGNQLWTSSYTGPVNPRFAGWTIDNKPPVVGIVGLGGERGLALGAIEYLEAKDVWAFCPYGVDGQYDQALSEANKELLQRIGADHIVGYSALEPFECFCQLESLTYGCLASERPLLLPFGPKIFAVVCLLVAELYRPRVPVWRVSSEQDGDPIDRVARGNIVNLLVTFGMS